jgi:hypothetical protein
MDITKDEVQTEVARIKADPVQMQIVVFCLMMHPDFADMALAVHSGMMQGDTTGARQFALAVENHVIEHAIQTVQLRHARTLLNTPAASATPH